MAVLDKRNVAQQKSDTEESTGKGKSEGIVVDILQDKTLPTGERRKHDITEDAWAYSAPPPTGRYKIKLHPAKDPVTIYKNDDDRPPIYNIAIEGEIVESKDGEFDKVRVFPRVSTAVGRGKGISTAAGLIVKLGYKLPEEIDDLSLARLVLKALMKEPMVDVEIDWQAYSKEDKRVVYRGMHKFPQDAQGEPMHVVDYMTKAKVTEEIRANLDVTHWYGKGETGNVRTPKRGEPAKVVQTVTLAPDPDEEDAAQAAPVVPAPTPVAVKAKATAAPAPVQQSIEDELAELEEA